MIGSTLITLIEQKAAVERALATSVNKPRPNMMVARCQWVVGKRLSIQNNRVSMDEIEKVVLIQTNRSFDLSRPMKLATFRVFIYS